jgi:pimeloyl-ACP methyl ester carboxylesterase
MPYFEHDGLRFHYRWECEGTGPTLVWQHGLGSDLEPTFALLRQPPGLLPQGLRLLGFDARGHGETRPLGDPRKVEMAQSADDLRALLDHLGVDRAVVGGISMGAAIALKFAVRQPDRVLGLVLSRPAWLDRPYPENVRVFTHIAQYLVQYGPAEGLARFQQTPEYAALVRDSPDSAQVVLNNFGHPRARECVARLERIPHDAPARDRREWQAIRVPTLVLGNRQDPIHPWELAETLAASIPGAELGEITPKSVSPDRHAEDVQRRLSAFLARHFVAG